MQSHIIKLVVEQVSDIMACEDPFLTKHATIVLCNDLLQFLACEAAKSPTFAVSIWHYLLDNGYQIGNCARHDEFEQKFHDTLVKMTAEQRAMLRRISQKMFVKSNLTQA